MTVLAIDMAEQVPYSASLVESTSVAREAAFRARPPTRSPAGAIHEVRTSRMRELLQENIAEMRISPSPSVRANFEHLLRLLPSEMPLTDPYVSEAGGIDLDWDFDPQCQISIMLKEKGQIAFAAYFSGEKVHGSTRFSSQELPEILAVVAKRWSRELGARSHERTA